MEVSKRVTAERGEVFSKQSLKFSDFHKLNEKAHGKQKRRERALRPKSSAGQKLPRKQQDILMQIKAKEELLQASSKENAVVQKDGSTLITRKRLTQKLGIYGKGKASETVTRRKTLGDIKSSNCTKTATQHDLKRVLGLRNRSPSVGHPLKSLQNFKHITPPQLKRVKCTPVCRVGEGEASSNEMECSPLPPPAITSLATKIPLKKIAQRLADSLNPEELFPESNYLKNAKDELRKLMKQSNPSNYSQLARCLAEEPMACGSPMCKEGPHEENLPFHAMPSYSPQDNTSSLALLFGANTSEPPTSTHSQPPSSTLSYLPPVTTVPDSLPPVILNGDSADATLPPLCPPTELRHSQSVDFLDLMNNAVLPVSSPKSNPPSRHSQWMPTPDRPRMFPRKLY